MVRSRKILSLGGNTRNYQGYQGSMKEELIECPSCGELSAEQLLCTQCGARRYGRMSQKNIVLVAMTLLVVGILLF
ncbi:MAG: 50S ribosomal protein L32, partial [Candidatus Thermoplasmatota archaeon]